MAGKIIEINTDECQSVKVGDDLFENRAAVVDLMQQSVPAEVTIVIQAYGRLEKTKRCVDSVLKYTKEIDYELVLIDNGSTDDTLEYFQSVPWEKKIIWHISQNMGSMYPALMLGLRDFGRYICIIANDIIVTENWLKNLLFCMNSNSKIGMVVPVSSNVSNLQEVDLPYKTYHDMQAAAAKFNRSDPQRWEDRLRLITPGALYRKEVLLALGWPLGDVGFFHDFGDDDVSFAIRRMGYRTVLAGDTWVCHDHDYKHGEGKTPEEFTRSLNIGRANFQEKYFGVDAWDDVNNYYMSYLNNLPHTKDCFVRRVLGVDVRCGTPILDIKNRLRKLSIYDVELSAFTQNPKYWTDLKTICSGIVACDREEFLIDSFPCGYFDYIVADRPLNCYHEPQKMINDLFALCKPGGTVLCKVKNAFSFLDFVQLLGQRDVSAGEFFYNISLETFYKVLSKLGMIKNIFKVPYSVPIEQRQILESLIPNDLPAEQKKDVVDRMLCEEFIFIVQTNLS